MDENIKKKIDENWKEKKAVETEADKTQEEQKMPDVDFKFFLTTLGMQAWIALGKIPNPMTQQIEENKNQAKFIIDTLDILEKKTKGNLMKEESELLENLLYDLRLNYVDAVKLT